MKKIAILLLFILFLGCASKPSATGQAMKKYENYNAFFSVAYPPNWNATAANDSREQVIVALGNSSDEGVFVNAFRTEEQNATQILESMDAAFAHARTALNMSIREQASYTIDFKGTKAAKKVLLVQANGKLLRDVRIAFYKNGFQYSLVSISVDGDKESEKTNMDVVNSFSFLRPPPIKQ